MIITIQYVTFVNQCKKKRQKSIKLLLYPTVVVSAFRFLHELSHRISFSHKLEKIHCCFWNRFMVLQMDSEMMQAVVIPLMDSSLL